MESLFYDISVKSSPIEGRWNMPDQVEVQSILQFRSLCVQVHALDASNLLNMLWLKVSLLNMDKNCSVLYFMFWKYIK